LSLSKSKVLDIAAYIKVIATNEILKQSSMAFWKGPPVLTWRDNHSRQQGKGLGTMELSNEAKAHIHWSTWII